MRRLNDSEQLATPQINQRLDGLTTRNFNTRAQPMDIQVYTQNINTIGLLPGMGIYDQSERYNTVWINGVLYTVPCLGYSDSYGSKRPYIVDINKVGIDLPAGVGGCLDNSNPTDPEGLGAYLLWAIANDANSEYAGIGYTALPLSTYTSITNGTKGSTIATITMSGTGLNQAYRFSVGAKVVVRNTVGTAPNYEWNQGFILEIPDNQTLVLVMDNHSNDGSTDISNEAGEVMQFDKFRCFNDAAYKGYVESAYPNARLIGDFKTVGTNFIAVMRTIWDDWTLVSPMPIGLTITGSGSAYARWKRWIPPWTRALEFRVETYTTGSLQYTISTSILTAVLEDIGAPFKTAQRVYLLHLVSSDMWNLFTTTVSGIGGLTNVAILGMLQEFRP